MRRGQVAILLLLAMVGIGLMIAMNFAICKAFKDKMLEQNAGDAAAVEAAYGQGMLLNYIGQQNLKHMETAKLDMVEDGEGNLTNAIDLIVHGQRQTCLLGPLTAYASAQRAAQKMGIKPKIVGKGNEMYDILTEHVWKVLNTYKAMSNVYPEPYEGAWDEYAERLSIAANNSICVGADNIVFYGSEGQHWLKYQPFYNAVKSHEWCWFFFNMHEFMKRYGSYKDWPGLDPDETHTTDNCEVFPLNLCVKKCALSDIYTMEEIQAIAEKYKQPYDLGTVTDTNQYWFFFSDKFRQEWSQIKGGYPAVGEPLEECDYFGCSAVVRCGNWDAAAKPFGEVDEKGLVLPTFNKARLIPVDTADCRCLKTTDYGWVKHVNYHLEPYLMSGELKKKCEWCKLIKKWDRASFRRLGLNWLKRNSGKCRISCCGGNTEKGSARGH